jgi:hypothetical protein
LVQLATYAVVERVLDEYDQQACYATEAEYLSAIAPQWWPDDITTDRGYWIGRIRVEFFDTLLAEPNHALFDERRRKIGEPAPDRATIEYHRDRIRGLVVDYERRCREEGRDIKRPARRYVHRRDGR